ncbi:MAG: guanylate kinase [Gammaproteobacteria bacterium]|nr:guanylate kinase [Gammaproteobacteria bacterium]
MGSLFTIAAASGSGKTSLVKGLTETLKRIQVSISHTTRPAREGENNGDHYFFVSKQQFLNMIGMNEFLEHAEVFGHYYGTSKSWVEETLEQGIDVILEIDWQGASQIRKQFPYSTSIFILPPSIQILRERLLNRRQDSLDIIEQRLSAASTEISHCKEFDYLVINGDFDHALSDLRAIIKSKRLESGMQLKRHSKLLEDLAQNQ